MKQIILIILTIALLLSCEKKPDWKDIDNGVIQTSYNESRQTIHGATIRSRYPITNAQVNIIDRDLEFAFTDAIASGYQNALDQHFYTIDFPYYPCELSPIQQIPSFKIRADAYDGAEFDQYNPKGVSVKDGIGVIFAAEMVLQEEGAGRMVACPDSINAARYGAEHIIIKNNDIDYYNKTWFHSDGITHPLLPKK